MPTWNYAVVKPRTACFGLSTIQRGCERMWSAYTEHSEAPTGYPVVVTDAPAEFVDKMVASQIVGLRNINHALVRQMEGEPERSAADRSRRH